ncbi:hypothetical protein BJ508DRAFT_380576 [Ascobolus immersus RN42]|uniref:Uncharacterized protein n=1 Tax=Ascobolus immersus RN42 TaxID=1160509 RepID=A0A3N4HKV4_ASCIM|nr:hypothetical protein BJ508DRAFT_380576 [Ascobolus immersus RN42]
MAQWTPWRSSFLEIFQPATFRVESELLLQWYRAEASAGAPVVLKTHQTYRTGVEDLYDTWISMTRKLLTLADQLSSNPLKVELQTLQNTKDKRTKALVNHRIWVKRNAPKNRIIPGYLPARIEIEHDYGNFRIRNQRKLVSESQMKLVEVVLKRWLRKQDELRAAVLALDNDTEEDWTRVIHTIVHMGRESIQLLHFIVRLRSESIESRIWRHLEAQE